MREVKKYDKLWENHINILEMNRQEDTMKTIGFIGMEMCKRDRFNDDVMIASITPGALPVEVATGIGRQSSGLKGMAAAATAMALPGALLTVLLLSLIHIFKQSGILIGGKKMTKNTKTVVILLVSAALIAIVPLFALKGAEFGGSDDAGSEMISEIQGKEYEPWFTPVLETALGGELPGEIESLIFCLQTGIGVGIVAFVLGRFVERKKWQDKENGDSTSSK